MSINKVLLIGRLGADPESRYLPNDGTMVVNFSIATTEKWKGQDGSPQEHTEWHRCVAFGKLAETIMTYLGKGRLVYVEGSIRTREWENKDKQKVVTKEIRVRTVQFLDSNGAKKNGAAATDEAPAAPLEGDDVPF